MKKKPSASGGLIFLVWLVYATSYLGKVNYSANITQIVTHFGVTKSEAGLVPTMFFFAYGAGQVVNGLLCKHYPIRWMIPGSLLVSATINLIVGLTPNFAIIKWLWMVNGFALSVLWPCLIRLSSESFSQKSLSKSVVALGTTVASGTLVIYGLSSIFATFDGFRLAFFTAAIADGAVAVFWFFRFKALQSKALAEKNSEVLPENTPQEQKQSVIRPRLVWTMVGVLCLFAVGCNLMKDGLNTWVPTILKETYNFDDSIAIFLTLFLPIVAVFGTFFAVSLHKKIPDFVTHCLVLFLLMGGLIGGILWSLGANQAVVLLLCMIATSLLASSMNNVITSMFPMYMRGSVNSGMVAGVVDGFCYLGSAISAYGLGSVAESRGWDGVFWLLLGVCGLTAVIWGIYITLKSIWKKA